MPKYVDGAGLSRFWDNIQDQIGSASQEQVDSWLTAHPEATTTVQDGSITISKLATDVLNEIGNNFTNTESGTSITLDGAYSSSLVSLHTEGSSTQDGTPTASSPVAISSVSSLTLKVVTNGTTSSTPIALQGNQLRSLPDGTHDELSVDSAGNVSMVRRVKSVSADTSGWTLGSNGAVNSHGIAYVQLNTGLSGSSTIEGAKHLMSSLPKSSGNWSSATGREVACNQQALFYRFPSSGTATVASALADMRANGFEALIPYTNVSTLDLDSIDMPQVSDGSTVSLDGSAGVTITYQLGANSVLDVLTSVAEEMTNGISSSKVVRNGTIQLSGTKVEDKAWRIDASGPTTDGTNYEYVDYSLDGIDATQLIVTGTSYGNPWPLITFYNSNSSIISSYGTTGSIMWTDEAVDVPAGSVRCVVNGSESHNASVSYVGAKETQEEFDVRVDAILADITRKSRKWLFIGDSYSQGYSHDGNNSGWTTYLVGYMGLSSDEYKIANRGGASFATVGNSFLQLLQGVDGSGYTDIVVCGGFSDFNKTQADIEAAIDTFCQTAWTLFPDARIHVGEVAHIKQGTGSSAYSNWQEVRTKIETIVVPAYQNATKYGARYLNNVEYLLGDSGLTPTDGYHPSAEGNMAIAAGVANALLTGSAPLPYNSTLRAS